MSYGKEIIASSSLGSITTNNCGFVTIDCGSSKIRLPKSSFTKFSAMVDVAYANLISQELSLITND